MTKQSLFHIGISDPERLRKDLLEAARATISCLQRYEKFMGVREDKKKAIDEFSVIIKEIYELDTKLNKTLPKTGIKTKKPEVGKKKMLTKKEGPKKRDIPKSRLDELEVLEKELAKIDSALSKLK